MSFFGINGCVLHFSQKRQGGSAFQGLGENTFLLQPTLKKKSIRPITKTKLTSQLNFVNVSIYDLTAALF